MSEHSLAQLVRSKLHEFQPNAHWSRTENLVGVGVPDVNLCVSGAHVDVELKELREWPTREATIVRLHHDLSQEQRIWLMRRYKAGGRAGVLLRVAQTREYLWLWAPAAAELVSTVPRKELVAGAAWHCTGELDIEGLVHIWCSSR